MIFTAGGGTSLGDEKVWKSPGKDHLHDSRYSGTCLRVYCKLVSQSNGLTSLGLHLHVYKDLKTGSSTTQPNLPKVIHPQGNQTPYP